MMNIFKKYRVKEVNGRFIPQRRTGIGWEGIDRNIIYLWYHPNIQEERCSFCNLQDAKERLEKYKKQKTIKYYY